MEQSERPRRERTPGAHALDDIELQERAITLEQHVADRQDVKAVHYVTPRGRW